MAVDYSSWKVVDLKAELKRRDIPQTGLRLKQQIVDKLLELDNENAGSHESSGEEQPAAADEAVEKGDTAEEETPQPATEEIEPPATTETEADQPPSDSVASQEKSDHRSDEEQPSTKEEPKPSADTQSSPSPQAEAAQPSDAPEPARDTDAPVQSDAKEVASNEDDSKTVAPKDVEHADQPASQEDSKGSTPAAPIIKDTPDSNKPASQIAADAAAPSVLEFDTKTENKVKETVSEETTTKDTTPHDEKVTADAPEKLREREASPPKEDTKKRRRSKSPSPADAGAKKVKSSTDADAVAASEPRKVEADETLAAASTTVEAPAAEATAAAPLEPRKVETDETIAQATASREASVEDATAEPSKPRAADEPTKTPAEDQPKKQDRRWLRRSLPKDREGDIDMDRESDWEPEPDARSPTPLARREGVDASPSNAEPEPAVQVTSPSLHPPTRSLYICNLMRPLQPTTLKSYLAAIGDASRTDTSIITEFYLDPIKTHCFVTFAKPSAAIRVRNAMHEVVWPNERMRKQLWVDFIPDDKVRSWTEREQLENSSNGPSRGMKRWEVIYDTTGGDVRAELRCSNGSGATGHHTASSSRTLNRSDQHDQASTSQTYARQPAQGFKALDELFKFTKTKPRLYYMPVPQSTANLRLARFDDLDWLTEDKAGYRNEIRRFTFENQDEWVDVGPDALPYRNRTYNGVRARRGGRGRGRGGDFWRAR